MHGNFEKIKIIVAPKKIDQSDEIFKITIVLSATWCQAKFFALLGSDLQV